MLVLLTAAVTGVWADDETVTYALKTSDSFTSGQTVEVKNAANDVVATITYGESGGANFNSPKKDNHVEGFEAFTEGNGTNGDKTGGTFYTITPKVNATITVAVVLNADKAFYILEDGTALANYNGITVSSKYYGTYEFDAKANKAYKFYCAGSKLGFYGFKMTNITAPSGGGSGGDWTDIIINGDLEGTDLQCFFAKEHVKCSEITTFATVADGIGKNGSRAIKVQSSGNEVNDYDTQFFIRLPYELPAGTKYRLTFDYKADIACSCDFESHNEPEEYIIWYIGSNVPACSFKTDWDTYDSGELSVPSDADGSQGSGYKKNFQTIAFKLANNQKATQFIIDNIKVEVLTSALSGLTPHPYMEALIAKAQALVDAGGDAEAVGKLQAAIATAQGIANPTFDDILALQAATDQFQKDSITDIIINGDLEGSDLQCFFAKEDGKGSEGTTFATVVDGVGKNGSRAIVVQSSGNEVNNWDTQFYVRLPYVLPKGTKYKVSFDYKANKASHCYLQICNEPDEYVHWSMSKPNRDFNWDFGTDWNTMYSGEMTVPDECDGSQNAGGYLNNFQTISFSMGVTKEATEFIIDNIKVEVDKSELSGLTPHPYMEALIAKAQALVDAGGDAEAVGNLQAAIATAKGIANPTFDDILALQAAIDQFQQTTTAIISIKDDKVESATYYDLSGRRIDHPAKGVYVKNGKKVVVK